MESAKFDQELEFKVIKGNVGGSPIFLLHDNYWQLNIATNDSFGTTWHKINTPTRPNTHKGDYVVLKAVVDTYGDLYLYPNNENCYLKILKTKHK